MRLKSKSCRLSHEAVVRAEDVLHHALQPSAHLRAQALRVRKQQLLAREHLDARGCDAAAQLFELHRGDDRILCLLSTHALDLFFDAGADARVVQHRVLTRQTLVFAREVVAVDDLADRVEDLALVALAAVVFA